MTLEIVTPGGTRSVADCTSIRLYTSAGTPGWVGFRNGCARTAVVLSAGKVAAYRNDSCVLAANCDGVATAEDDGVTLLTDGFEETG